MKNLYEYIKTARKNMLNNREALQVGRLGDAGWLMQHVEGNINFMSVFRALRDIENIPMNNTTMRIVRCETAPSGWEFETNDLELKAQEIEAFANMLIAIGRLDYY